jgi:hypothetical protein
MPQRGSPRDTGFFRAIPKPFCLHEGLLIEPHWSSGMYVFFPEKTPEKFLSCSGFCNPFQESSGESKMKRRKIPRGDYIRVSFFTLKVYRS